MSHRFRDRDGNLVVVQGRQVIRPFGSIPPWPMRTPAQQRDLDDMQAAESAANEQRAAYRRWEARQPCGGCGHAAPGHEPGCIWR